MPNPLAAADVVGHTLRFSELGLATAVLMASASPLDLTAYKTAVPETVIVLCRFSSGTATITVDTTADGVYASAVATKTNATGTDYHALVVDTDATNAYVNVRFATSANAILDKLLVLPLARLVEGEDWYNVRDGVMAVAHNDGGLPSGRGDGSGVFSFGVSD